MKLDKRKAEEEFFKILMRISALIVMSSLLLIVGSVFAKGFPSLSIEMLTETPKGGFYMGGEGGILNSIIGSLYLAFGATVLALIIGYPIVIYMNVYAGKDSKRANLIRVCFDVLWGIPSIVYGAFGFVIMIFLGIKTSLLAGILVITLVVLPVIVRTIDEVVRMVPNGLFEASYALGATRFETAFKVISRQVLPVILTSVLVAFGRAIGDAAAVLFTAGFTDYIPTSLFQSAATLPLAIFFQLGSPIVEVRERAYASAFVLTVIILLVSVISRFLIRRYKKFKV
ncbi:MAG: phosphate ABC transporter permease PstA [Bacteroidota bacterium]